MIFGHKRILGVVVVMILVALSTVVGERLQDVRRIVPIPGFRRLLPVLKAE